MKKISTFIIVFFLMAAPVYAQSLLKNYDSRPAKYSMDCYTNNTDWVTFEIVDNKIYTYSSSGRNWVHVSEKDESRGLFAAIILGGVLGTPIGNQIVDYKNRKVTQTSAAGVEVFRCK